MKSVQPPPHFVSRLYHLLLSKPGLSLLYGPQGAYKTSLALKALNMESVRVRVLVLTGKHVMLEDPPGVTVMRLHTILDDLKLPFDLEFLSVERGLPLAVVYDSFVANFAGARGYMASRAVLKSLVACLALLRDHAARRGSSVLLVSPRHPYTGSPPLWKFFSRFVERIIEVSVGRGVVTAVQRAATLEPLATWTTPESELREYLEDPEELP